MEVGGQSSEEFSPSAMENGEEETDINKVNDGISPLKEDLLMADDEDDSKFQSMTEKGIRHLCLELLDLKKASTEELQRNVYSNHSAFVRSLSLLANGNSSGTCIQTVLRIFQEVTDLERELMELKMHISQQGILVRDMKDSISLESLSSNSWTNMSSGSLCVDHEPSSEIEHRIYHLSDILGVLLSEHKEGEALSVLEAEERYFLEVQKEENISSSLLALYQSVLSKWKGRLAEQLVQIVKQPRIRSTELHKVLSGLCRLGDGPHAHTLLLNSYHLRLKNKIQNLFPSCGIYSANYMTTLSRVVFSTISLAAKHSVEIFGEASAYTSELVLWAHKETDNFVQLIMKHVLSFKERAGGLQSSVAWVQVAVGHCSLLEGQGIALCPYLIKLIKPFMEEVLAGYIKRIEINVSIAAANDNWSVTTSQFLNHFVDKHSNLSNMVGNLATHCALTSSAHKFISMVQDILEDLAPLINLQIGQSIVDSITVLFDKYIGILARAMPCLSGDELKTGFSFDSYLNPAKTESQQLALLANATALAEILPHSASKSSVLKDGTIDCPSKGNHMILRKNASHIIQCKDWRCFLQHLVDKLRDQFCQQYVLNQIYSTQGDTRLTALRYLNDKNKDLLLDQNPMPSSPFQAWFLKLIQLDQLSADILDGRDRATSQLLLRLTETFVIWLSSDKEFWDMMEHSSLPLNPFGLQQFVLDMNFLVESAIHGHYFSRHIQQMVLKITRRAMTASSTTSGNDPESCLPNDGWFSKTSQEAINKLLTKQAEISFEMDDSRSQQKLDDLGIQEFKEQRDHENMLHQEPDLIPYSSPSSLRSEGSSE